MFILMIRRCLDCYVEFERAFWFKRNRRCSQMNSSLPLLGTGGVRGNMLDGEDREQESCRRLLMMKNDTAIDNYDQHYHVRDNRAWQIKMNR